MARDLAAAAARSPHPAGKSPSWTSMATPSATASPAPDAAAGSGRGHRVMSGYALPARINITVTETLGCGSWQHRRPSRAPAPRQATGNSPRTIKDRRGTWILTLPGGRELAVRFDVVPTHDCDHRYQVNGYEPGERLRRLVQVRDHECTFPPCSRPARDSDFEHAVPYDKGGATDACNAGARSRRCHQVKQMPGGRSPSQSRAGTYGLPRPAGPTSRNHGGTSHD